MSPTCSGSLPPAPPSPYVYMRKQGYSDMRCSDYSKLEREIGRGTAIPVSWITRGFVVEIMEHPTTLGPIPDYKDKVIIDCIISLGGDASRNTIVQQFGFKTGIQEGQGGKLVLACNSIGTLSPLPGCLVELVPRMMAGEKWRVTISSGSAYGARGVVGLVPPNTNLVCEIELRSIEKESKLS